MGSLSNAVDPPFGEHFYIKWLYWLSLVGFAGCAGMQKLGIVDVLHGTRHF